MLQVGGQPLLWRKIIMGLGCMSVNHLLKNRWQFFLYMTALLQLLAIAYFAFHFVDNGYLPSPFLNDKSNTYMDFYNTLCWFTRDEYYSTWSSIYPPINFLFLQLYQDLFGIDACSASPEHYRADNIIFIWPFIALVFLVPFATLLLSKDRQHMSFMSQLLLGIIIVFSPALLFAWERGNLILICIFFLIGLVNTERRYAQVFLILLLMNIKPYFLLLSLYFLAIRDIKAFLITGIGAFLFFFVTGQLLQENQFLIIDNILGFSQSSTIFSLREALSFPPNLSSFSYALSSEKIANAYFNFPIHPSHLASLIELAKKVLLLTALLVFLRNAALISTPLAFLYLTALITNIGVSVGGYSLFLYLAFLPYLYVNRRQSWQMSIIYVVVLMLSLSFFDLLTLTTHPVGTQIAFLSGNEVAVNWSLTFGSILRPSLNFFLLVFMVYMVYKQHAFLFDDRLKFNEKITSVFKRVKV